MLKKMVRRVTFQQAISLLLICSLGSLVSDSVFASAIFEATVPVESQSANERSRAARAGMRTVLLRIAGSQDVLASPVIRDGVGQARRYIEQYRYTTLDEADEVNEGPQQAIVISFTQSLLTELLQDAQVPYWPLNRPTVLVWLVEDSADGRNLVNDPESPLLSSIFDVAKQRGLGLKLPLLDLDDQLALSGDQVWDLDEAALFAASERYAASTLLIGRYSQTSGGDWFTSWQFFHRGESQFTDMRSDDPEQIAAIAINPLADYLAQRYSVLAGDTHASGIVIRVDGIGGFEHYRGILNYLDKVVLIEDHEILHVKQDALYISLQINGEIEQLRNALSLDRRLMSDDFSEAESIPQWALSSLGTFENPLRYRWGVN